MASSKRYISCSVDGGTLRKKIGTDGDTAAVIRDTVYIDGGFLFWEPGMSDGTYGAPTNDGNMAGNTLKAKTETDFIRKSIRNCILLELQHSLQHNTVLQHEQCLRNDIEGRRRK
jgi:hypothetical protein